MHPKEKVDGETRGQGSDKACVVHMLMVEFRGWVLLVKFLTPLSYVEKFYIKHWGKCICMFANRHV